MFFYGLPCSRINNYIVLLATCCSQYVLDITYLHMHQYKHDRLHSLMHTYASMQRQIAGIHKCHGFACHFFPSSIPHKTENKWKMLTVLSGEMSHIHQTNDSLLFYVTNEPSHRPYVYSCRYLVVFRESVWPPAIMSAYVRRLQLLFSSLTIVLCICTHDVPIHHHSFILLDSWYWSQVNCVCVCKVYVKCILGIFCIVWQNMALDQYQQFGYNFLKCYSFISSFPPTHCDRTNI